MPKKFLKRLLPDHKTVREHRHLQFFGRLMHDPFLWHLNRRSVPRAFSVGLFVAFVPIPFQMVLAAALAIFLRANLPISVALVWVTNPVTMPPMYFFAYKLGSWMLNTQPERVHFERSLNWLLTELAGIWEPFLLGCLILGTVSAVVGNVVIRSYWRLQIINARRDRRRRREAAVKRKHASTPPSSTTK